MPEGHPVLLSQAHMSNLELEALQRAVNSGWGPLLAPRLMVLKLTSALSREPLTRWRFLQAPPLCTWDS
jgi:hypothetical protein